MKRFNQVQTSIIYHLILLKQFLKQDGANLNASIKQYILNTQKI